MFRKSVKIRVVTSIMFIACLLVLLSYSQASANVTRAELLISSTDVANYMEEYRQLPQNVQVGIQSLSTSQFLYLMAIATIDINQNVNNDPYPIPVITDPSNPYPSITFNDGFYKSPLSKIAYMDLLSTVYSFLSSNIQAPDYFTYQANQIRYCAMVHYLSSILRFYEFYGYLPNSMDIKVISPRNLVPIGWETPVGMEHYTSGITYHINSDDNLYYRHNVLDYSTFKLAKQLVESNNLYPDLYSSLETVYDWARFETWLKWGYGQIYFAPFLNSGLNLWSAREAWTVRLSASGGHAFKMVALYRSLGIPAYHRYVYFIPEGRWLNIEDHYPFGSAPHVDADGNMYPGYEDSPLPSPTKDFVNEISSLINYESPSQNQLTDLRGFFINASDISAYGVDRIVSAAKLGGHNTIILTVKTPYGSLYADEDVIFPSGFYDPVVTDYSTDTKWQVKSLELDPLFTAAHKEGIKVHLGFNVLMDYLTGYKQFKNFPEKHPNWSQWNGTQSNAYATAMISPCISDYLTLIKDVLEAYMIRYPADGAVIMGLRWLTGRDYDGAPRYGYNPKCKNNRTKQDWYEQVLIDYLQELVTKIRSIKPMSHISFLSASLYDSPINPTEGLHNYLGQNLFELSQNVDNMILNIGGHYWLTDSNYDLGNVFKYDFEKIYSDMKAQTNTPISIAFYLRDEWEYPSEFFHGLYKYTRDSGLEGFHLYSLASGWGEWGPAFIESQWDKIQNITFVPHGSDNDSDGYTYLNDCDDSDPAVNTGAAEVCYDGIDNNCDGNIDEGCGTVCSDYADRNSCNNNLDCEWVGGKNNGTCQEAIGCNVTEDPEVSCVDGIDNDCDGLTDTDDPDCVGGCVPEPEICNDGIDNDCDGKIDCSDKGSCKKDPAC